VVDPVSAEHEPAFEAFVAARSSDLLRIALLLTGDRGAAEDLLSTALSRSYGRWDRIEGDPYPSVRRLLVAGAAGRRLRATQEIVTLPSSGPMPPDGTDAVAERERLASLVSGLPPRMRAVLVLRYAEGLGEEATAEVLGCSVATVGSQTVQALARLRGLLAAPAASAFLEEC
jgi:RNA polymerase sigma factor (sigma-70 family)